MFDVNPTPLADGDQHHLTLLGECAPDLATWTSPDALALFGVSPTLVDPFLAATRGVLTKASRRAAAHGADPASLDVRQSRIGRVLREL